MSNLNVAAMSGNLTRDAELRQTANGTPVLSFSMAVNHPRKDANGEWVQEADFFDWEYYGRAAQGIEPYMSKGRHVAVYGRARQNRWEKDGQRHSRVVFIASEIDLGPRETAPDGQGAPRQATNQAPMPTRAQTAYEAARRNAEAMGATIQEPSVYDSDIPFD